MYLGWALVCPDFSGNRSERASDISDALLCVQHVFCSVAVLGKQPESASPHDRLFSSRMLRLMEVLCKKITIIYTIILSSSVPMVPREDTIIDLMVIINTMPTFTEVLKAWLIFISGIGGVPFEDIRSAI